MEHGAPAKLILNLLHSTFIIRIEYGHLCSGLMECTLLLMLLTIPSKMNNIKIKTDTRPIMSPYFTNTVKLSFKGKRALRYAGFHHFVEERISPRSEIKADIPVLAHLAMERRVSIALKEA